MALTTREKLHIDTGCALAGLGQRVQDLLDEAAAVVAGDIADGSISSAKLATGDLQVPGAIIGYKDNATSARVKGPQHASEGGADVQSYSGIFYNDGYDTLGTLKTRFILGANLEMDMAIVAPHQLQIVAADNTQADGEMFLASKTKVRVHARVNPEVEAPSELFIDRVDQGSVDEANTSDVNLDVSAGNLRLMSGNTAGAPVLGSMTEAQRDALTPVAGMVLLNTTTSKLNFYTGSGWEAVTSA